MLKNLDPLLSAELLHVLASMGHGDDLAVVDRNFPAVSVAQRLVQLDGADLLEATSAILSIFPLDSFVDEPALRMEVVGRPEEIPDVQVEAQAIIDEAEGRHIAIGSLERHAFYAHAKQAFAVVATGESRPYGNFIFRKGVIFD